MNLIKKMTKENSEKKTSAIINIVKGVITAIIFSIIALIIFSCNPGAIVASGFIEEPHCLTLCVALFCPLEVFFSPNPPTNPTTLPVL